MAVTFGTAAGFRALGRDAAKAVNDGSAVLEQRHGDARGGDEQREARLPPPDLRP